MRPRRLLPPSGKARSFQRSSGEFADAAEYREYLVKTLDDESDPRIRWTLKRLIAEVDSGEGVGAVFKARKVDRERLAYLHSMAERHPSPEMRSRAEAVLEGRS